jgi:ankyrin repeat protein
VVNWSSKKRCFRTRTRTTNSTGMLSLVRLLIACQKDNLNQVRTLIIMETNLNNFDQEGRTCLQVAASEGHLDTVKYLVSHGALLAHRDIRGNTALDEARIHARDHVTRYLEALDQQDSTKNTN